KWTPRSSRIDLGSEARRLRWAVTFTPVPRLLGEGTDESGSWIVTSPVPGRSAVEPRWMAEPQEAVKALGEGLRALHDALPVESCPFAWTAEGRVADARSRASQGRIDPARWHPVHRLLTIEDALELLSDIPPVDQAVVCHGDACAPNTLLTDDGHWAGHVDFGALGVADRWADLAIATWSSEWNYGPGWEGLLLDAYGVSADPDRTRYYRLLWDLDP
ncbi:MAG: phosphotransferase, partial [Mycobacteriales bacterium]